MPSKKQPSNTNEVNFDIRHVIVHNNAIFNGLIPCLVSANS